MERHLIGIIKFDMSRNEAILLNSLVLTETQNCQPESNTQNEKENFIFIKFTNRAGIIFLTYSAIQIKKKTGILRIQYRH